jgi:hypothetical protein
MRFVPCLAVLLFFSSIAARAAQVSIVAGRDNTIFSESNNSGGAATAVFSGRNNGGNLRRGLLWFDVASSIPPLSSVNAASLTLRMDSAAQTETQARDVRLHELLGGWGEGSSGGGGPGSGQGQPATQGDATWTYQFFDTDPWTMPGADFAAQASATASVGTAVDHYSWASTPLLVEDIQGWLDGPASNFGWVLIGDELANGSSRRFGSREATDPALRPVLTVEFTAVPEPASWLLLLGAPLLWGARHASRRGRSRRR